MPRVLGYVFNPVSFWLCYDEQKPSGQPLRAVICEVNNTFGEHHAYVCAGDEGQAIQPDHWFTAEKYFHVSPFLPREGHYAFRFRCDSEQFFAWIVYYDKNQNKTLTTTLQGQLKPFSTTNRCKAFFKYPLITLKATALIHWQAIKIVQKGIRYIKKPPQLHQRACRNQQKNSAKTPNSHKLSA